MTDYFKKGQELAWQNRQLPKQGGLHHNSYEKLVAGWNNGKK